MKQQYATAEGMTLVTESNAQELRLADIEKSKHWLGLALISIIVAGVLSLALVVGRIPIFAELLGDPSWIKRSLIVHVNLALNVWPYAFITSLFYLIPRPKLHNRFFNKLMLALGAIGIITMSVPGYLKSTEVLLTNYIPTLNHPLFFIGLIIFGLSMLGVFIDGLALSFQKAEYKNAILGPEIHVGLKAAALAFLSAMLTFYGSWLTTPVSYESKDYFELVFWGGGHILQVVSVCGMLCVWLTLTKQLTKKSVLTHSQSLLVFLILVLPTFAGPFMATLGTIKPSYYINFTHLMRYGIWPIVLVVLVKVIFDLIKNKDSVKLSLAQENKRHYFNGLIVSFSLTITGFVLGMMISTSTTLIPAHYHAAIGGVTASFMTMAYFLLTTYSKAFSVKRASIQVTLYGIGQFIFVAGFAMAGLFGALRKSYGNEQHVKSFAEYVGLTVMGVGGAIALVGGFLFLIIAMKAYLDKKTMEKNYV